jgi:hypothetical protein
VEPRTDSINAMRPPKLLSARRAMPIDLPRWLGGSAMSFHLLRRCRSTVFELVECVDWACPCISAVQNGGPQRW